MRRLAGFLLLGLLSALLAGCRPLLPGEGDQDPRSSAAGAAAQENVLPGAFVKEQDLGQGQSWDAALGDIDGDGFLDLAVASLDAAAPKIWTNDGAGGLRPDDQIFPPCFRAGFGDVNGDGHLDLILAEWEEGEGLYSDSYSVWMNGGSGDYSLAGRYQVGSQTQGFVLGDFNGDQSLDLFLFGERRDQVWFNTGEGAFEDSGQRLPAGLDAAAAVGDLDGDGDLDLLSGGWNGAPQVWLNDGQGIFTGSTVDFAKTDLHVHGLAVGDLDGDGDLDAFLTIANGGPHQVWTNKGDGTFILTQELPAELGHDVALGDLDGDGDLDAVTAHGTQSGGKVRLWVNQGGALFADSGLALGAGFTAGVALGDLDRDGDLDIISAQNEWGTQTGPPDLVWFHEWH